jgi:hypothetical protein
VNDQGIGIAPEEQAKLFRRFYRVDNRLRREAQGAGLGLFLARAIVEAQGGRIWVESAPGRGSRFSFTVPLATPRLVDFEGDEVAGGRRETAIASVSLATPRLVDIESDKVAGTQGAEDAQRLTMSDTVAQVGENP